MAARSILRVPASPELSRKAVADAAGVTPALVSYYFPEKDSLLAASTAPLVVAWVTQLLDIIGSPGSRRDRFGLAVTLLVALHEQEAGLIDNALHLGWQSRQDAQQSLLDAAYATLRAFLIEGIEAGEWRALDPDRFLAILWGMCKFVTRSRDDRPGNQGSRDQTRAELVVDLALKGLSR